jgi:hypothetical protein
MRDTFEFMDDKARIRGRFEDDDLTVRRGIRSNLIDVVVALHAETQPLSSERGAVLVSATGEEAIAIWIPKASCQFEHTGKTVGGKLKSGRPQQFSVVTLTLPQWVARNKGLI